MRKSVIVLALATATLFASCVDELPSNNLWTKEGKLTIVASVGESNSTKTAVQPNGTSIYWTPGDEINLFYGSSRSGKFSTSISEPTAVAEFTGTLTAIAGFSGSGNEASSFWGIYPYDGDNSCDGTGVTLSIPDEQNVVAGTFADKLNPSVATSSNLELSFYNVGSWFIFSVTQEGVTSATLRGNNNEDLAGRIHVTMDANGRPVAEVIDGAKSITISTPDGSAFEPGSLYYIVLLPQTLVQGYTLTLQKGTNLKAECVVSKQAEFARSSYRRKQNADDGLTYNLFGNIVFADDLVKSICVANWDTSGDGELSYEEAAAVTDLNNVFQNTEITSFHELHYFTGITTLNGTFNQCIFLNEVMLPNSLTSIGEQAFIGCGELTALNIPPGVTAIGTSAFGACKSLTEITVPSSLTTIGDFAFSNCINLRVIEFSEGSHLASIGEFSFAGCSCLSELDIPSEVQSIGRYAFDECIGLERVTFSQTSKLSYIFSGAFHSCSNLTEIEIPSSVICMGGIGGGPNSYGVFSNCSSLRTVIFPSDSKLTSIDEYTFYKCNSLTRLEIPSTVSIIRKYAFGGCKQLTTVVFSPDSHLTSIGAFAFSGCSCLSEISIPSTVTSFGRNAFSWCNSITEFIIPDGITTLEWQLFDSCYGLIEITIPSQITSIGLSAFNQCTNLKRVTIPSNSQLSLIDNYAFKGCCSLSDIIIPSSVTEIRIEAFKGCSSLLQTIVMPLNPPSLGRDCWIESPSIIYVPSESVDAYRTASGWCDYADRIISIDDLVSNNE